MSKKIDGTKKKLNLHIIKLGNQISLEINEITVSITPGPGCKAY